MTKRRAFTLIELLVSVAIIALLISIALPSISAARRVSKKTLCQQNLHQIGIGLQSYLQQNKEFFPTISPMQSIESELAKPLNIEPRPGIAKAFKRELGGTKNKVFECPADQVTRLSEDELLQIAKANSKLAVGKRYYDSEDTSYEWRVQFNGLHRNTKTVVFKSITIPVNLLAIVYDFDAFHGGPNMPGSVNNLYPDLRVQADKYGN